MRHQLLLAAIAAVLFLFNLGGTHLWDVDEAIFSQAAREMYERGDAVVPTFNGDLFSHKPAMMFWWMLHAFSLFGASEFAARFYSAVFGVGSVLLTYRLGRLLFSPTAAFWSALMLSTCLNFNVIARAATPDSYLVFFSTLAMLAFASSAAKARPVSAELNERNAPWAGQTRFEPSWAGWIAFYAATACGVLTKGPIGVVLPTASVGLFLLIVRARPASEPDRPGWQGILKSAFDALTRWLAPVHVLRTIWSMRPLTAVTVVLAVAAPWYVMVGLATDGRWPAEFFGVHNFGRFLGAMENHGGPPFYYLIAIAAGFFPWSIFAAPSILVARQAFARNHPWRPGYVFVCAWIAVWVGFFSIASTKLPSYVVPAYPAIALFTGAFAAAWLREPALLARTWTHLAWGCVALVGIGMIVAMPIVARVYLEDNWLLGTLGLLPLAAAVVGWILGRRGAVRGELTTLAVLGCGLSIAVFGVAAMYVDRFQDTQPLVARIGQLKPPAGTTVVAAYHQFRPSYVFYGGQNITQYGDADQVAAFFAGHGDEALLITNERSFEKLQAALPADVVVLESTRRFLRRDKVLLLGRKSAMARVGDSARR